MGVLPPLPRIYFFYASYSSVCISHLGFLLVFVCIDAFCVLTVFELMLRWSGICALLGEEESDCF